jgi:hypothetical protein
MVIVLQSDSFEFGCESYKKKFTRETSRLSFKRIDQQERETGVERSYEVTALFNCECGNTIEITFNVWEYPKRILDAQDCTCIGGQLTGSGVVPE